MLRSLDEIDAYIATRAAAGSRPADIAGNLDLSSAFIRDRMSALGFDTEPGSHFNKYRVDPMWNAEPDDRRHWIWQRQHDGAVAALRGAA